MSPLPPGAPLPPPLRNSELDCAPLPPAPPMLAATMPTAPYCWVRMLVPVTSTLVSAPLPAGPPEPALPVVVAFASPPWPPSPPPLTASTAAVMSEVFTGTVWPVLVNEFEWGRRPGAGTRGAVGLHVAAGEGKVDLAGAATRAAVATRGGAEVRGGAAAVAAIAARADGRQPPGNAGIDRRRNIAAVPRGSRARPGQAGADALVVEPSPALPELPPIESSRTPGVL